MMERYLALHRNARVGKHGLGGLGSGKVERQSSNPVGQVPVPAQHLAEPGFWNNSPHPFGLRGAAHSPVENSEGWEAAYSSPREAGLALVVSFHSIGT